MRRNFEARCGMCGITGIITVENHDEAKAPEVVDAKIAVNGASGIIGNFDQSIHPYLTDWGDLKGPDCSVGKRSHVVPVGNIRPL